MVSLSQSVYVSLAYRLWNNQWSHERNLNVYGAQASPEGVGGNWRIELTLQSDENAFTVPLARLKNILDHRSLFTDLEPFFRQASTLERVTQHLAGTMEIPWTRLTVHESERLACAVEPGSREVQLIQRENNLWLTLRGVPDEESGLLLARHEVTQQVIKIFKAHGAKQMADERTWAEWLFSHLRAALPLLESVRIDLGRDKYIFLSSKEK